MVKLHAIAGAFCGYRKGAAIAAKKKRFEHFKGCAKSLQTLIKYSRSTIHVTRRSLSVASTERKSLELE